MLNGANDDVYNAGRVCAGAPTGSPFLRSELTPTTLSPWIAGLGAVVRGNFSRCTFLFPVTTLRFMVLDYSHRHVQG